MSLPGDVVDISANPQLPVIPVVWTPTPDPARREDYARHIGCIGTLPCVPPEAFGTLVYRSFTIKCPTCAADCLSFPGYNSGVRANMANPNVDMKIETCCGDTLSLRTFMEAQADAVGLTMAKTPAPVV